MSEPIPVPPSAVSNETTLRDSFAAAFAPTQEPVGLRLYREMENLVLFLVVVGLILGFLAYGMKQEAADIGKVLAGAVAMYLKGKP